MTADEIRAALQDRNLSYISRMTGLSWDVLRKFAKVKSYYPKADFIEKLNDYMEKRP